jgi:hypothetical protein
VSSKKKGWFSVSGSLYADGSKKDICNFLHTESMSPTPQVNVRSPNPAEWNRNETLDWLRSLGKLTDEELQSFAVQNVNGYTIAKFAFYPEVYLEYHKKVLPLTIGSFVNLSNRLKELQGWKISLQ